jgi:TonB family protein
MRMHMRFFPLFYEEGFETVLIMQAAVSLSVQRLIYRGKRRFFSASFVVIVHVALLLFLAAGDAIRLSGQISHDLDVTIIAGPTSTKKPPSLPVFMDPMLPNVFPPRVVMNPDSQSPAPDLTTVSTQLIAPKLDSAHPNAQPLFPKEFVKSGSNKTIIVVVKIFVLRNGTISSCLVVGSSGIAVLDQAAIDFVKKYWHFLPASLKGESVDDWTTVEVPFGPNS